MNFDTIAAIATPAGNGGIGIIRISGDSSVSIVSSIFRRYSSEKNIQNSYSAKKYGHTDIFKSHKINYGHITDPVDQSIIDEVLILTMLAPRSYTKEDVVEIHSHASYIVLNLILNLLIKKGARLAEPGEFTKRAFLNGRIDLTQAESVIDIVNARTEQELKIATSHISGGMKDVINDVRGFLVNFLSLIDASIDFSDDVEEIINIDNITSDFQCYVFDKINMLVKHYNDGHFFRDGLKAIILGRPNVGKSSLMNCLIGNDRVIVSSLPGTTRDLVSETVNINDVCVNFCDTAGLHDSCDPVETIGIKKVYDHLISADLVIFVVDATCPFTDEDYMIFRKIQDKKVILVINKSDLIQGDQFVSIPDNFEVDGCVTTSALLNAGIDSLRKLIVKIFLNGTNVGLPSYLIPNMRHKTALVNAKENLLLAVNNIKNSCSPEIIALDITSAIYALDSITGQNVGDDILDQIFNSFCIGK